MKTNFLKLSSFVFCLLFLISCGKKDDAVSPATGLIGSWKVTDISYNGTSSVNLAGEKVSTDFTGKGYDMNLVIQFKESPKEFVAAGNYSIMLKVNFFGQTTEQPLTNVGFINSGTWSQSGNEITISGQKATVVEQTSNTLKIG